MDSSSTSPSVTGANPYQKHVQAFVTEGTMPVKTRAAHALHLRAALCSHTAVQRLSYTTSWHSVNEADAVDPAAEEAAVTAVDVAVGVVTLADVAVDVALLADVEDVAAPLGAADSGGAVQPGLDIANPLLAPSHANCRHHDASGSRTREKGHVKKEMEVGTK
ncbi:hypothetical protein CF328_g1030 [Tilletia controversa]|nr:hypothetical protein CF328_g1030 [Tilletia controversa]